MSTLLAPTPPMGWNSWISYACSVTEEEVRAQARIMARDLARFGYQYVVIDACWYKEIDEHGRFIPDPERFPCARQGGGLRGLADEVHSLGLKLGIHIMRGIPRVAVEKNTPILGSDRRAADVANLQSVCPWSQGMWGLDMTQPGAQAYLNSIVKMYAQWQVDFIKADDMVGYLSKGAPVEVYHAAEVEGIGKAIHASGRPMVLSLSPGDYAEASFAPHMRRHAQMARISPDFWDTWNELKRQVTLCEPWAEHIGNGFWPDADMLPLGKIGLRFDLESGRGPDRDTRYTPDEQRLFMTLCAIFRSPLMMGGDLLRLDAPTLALLTNPEVLAVNQASAGNRPLFHRGDHVAWIAQAVGTQDRYLAVFNLSDQGPAPISVDLPQLGAARGYKVRDLWEHQDLAIARGDFSPRLPAHGAGLYRLSPQV